MKILITYISAGAGHRKAAEALHEYFKKQSPENTVELVDAGAGASKLFAFFYIRGYNIIVKTFPLLWQAGFYFTDTVFFCDLCKIVNRALNPYNLKGFIKTLLQKKPDMVVSAHFLTSEIVSNLKKTGQLSSSLVTVVTDFKTHRFWLNEPTDMYAVASEFTAAHLKKRKIPAKRIIVTGIPVKEEFLFSCERSEARKKLGLEDTFTVTVVTGSFGIGPMEKVIRSLTPGIQVIALCGANKKLFAKLKALNLPGVFVYGFVDLMPLVMAASDCFVTKPGGLTVSELLAMEIPPVFFHPIPGQEVFNVQAMRHYGIHARYEKRIGSVVRRVLQYRNDSEKCRLVKERMKAVRQPHAAEAVYHVCQSCIRSSG